MAIFAWRRWEVSTFPLYINAWNLRTMSEQDLRLRGAIGTPWPIGQTLHAECYNIGCKQGAENTLRTIHNDRVYTCSGGAPKVHCRCGIYALKQPCGPLRFLNDGSHVSEVHGVVEIWGKIIQAEFGYRAECARVRALVDTAGTHQLTYNEANTQYFGRVVAENYGVPYLPSIGYAQHEYFGHENGNEK
jgi:hypothetical protein